MAYTNIGGWLVDLDVMPSTTLQFLIDNTATKLAEAERDMRILCAERARREEDAEVLYLPGMGPDKFPAA